MGIAVAVAITVLPVFFGLLIFCWGVYLLVQAFGPDADGGFFSSQTTTLVAGVFAIFLGMALICWPFVEMAGLSMIIRSLD